MELETSMPMYLTTLSKRGFCCVFFSFFVTFLLAVIIGAMGPPIVSTWDTTTKGDAEIDMSLNTTEFHWQIDGLDKLNQQLFFTAQVANKYYKKEGFKKELRVDVQLFGSLDDSKGEWDTLISAGKVAAKRTLKCDQDEEYCHNLTLVHEPFIHYPHYRVIIQFLNVNPNTDDFIDYVNFQWATFNHKFTLFELWFRFIFLLISFIVVFAFCYRLRSFQYNEWSLEQRWIGVLLMALMGYNNPFFPLDILVDHWVPAFLDAVLTSTFLCVLLLFWLCYFDGIRKVAAKRTLYGFYLPKIALLGFLWVATITTFTWEQIHELDNPSYNNPDDNPGFVVFEVVAVMILLAYLIWMVYVVIRAWQERRELPLLQLQLNFLGCFTLVVLTVTVIGIIVGVVGVIQNNAAEFLSFFALFNLYVYSLAFMWAPSSNSFTGGSNVPMTRLEESSDDDDIDAGRGRNLARHSMSSSEEDDRRRGRRGSSSSDGGRAAPAATTTAATTTKKEGAASASASADKAPAAASSSTATTAAAGGAGADTRV